MNDQFIQGVIFDWNKIDDDSYLKQIEALKNIERLEFKNSINFFVGENGSGKSTLLEAIAIAHGFNPEGGTKNYVFSTHDTHSELCNAIRIVKGYRKEKWGYFLRAESFYNVATKEEEYGGIDSVRYHERSHGEGFLALAQNNLQPNGLYLFDEPEAGIDLWSFKILIEVFEGMRKEIKGSIIIISHQERILNIADEIIVIAGGELAKRGTAAEILPQLLEDADGSATTGCRFYREGE